MLSVNLPLVLACQRSELCRSTFQSKRHRESSTGWKVPKTLGKFCRFVHESIAVAAAEPKGSQDWERLAGTEDGTAGCHGQTRPRGKVHGARALVRVPGSDVKSVAGRLLPEGLEVRKFLSSRLEKERKRRRGREAAHLQWQANIPGTLVETNVCGSPRRSAFVAAPSTVWNRPQGRCEGHLVAVSPSFLSLPTTFPASTWSAAERSGWKRVNLEKQARRSPGDSRVPPRSLLGMSEAFFCSWRGARVAGLHFRRTAASLLSATLQHDDDRIDLSVAWVSD